MTKTFDYDLLVIGAGSGGVRAARKSAEFGARVAVIEEAALGGTCVNVGCIPKKLYVYASEYAAAWEEATGFGWRSEGTTFDWSVLRDNKTKEIARLNAIYERLLEAPGVEIIQGHGKLTGPQEVAVGETRYRAEKILLATGTWPALPEIPGIELALTSNEIFDLPQLPERLLIVGGGYIATEFASIFSGLGSSVIQSYRGDVFLRGFDMDVRGFLAEEMRKAGVDLRFNHHVEALKRDASGAITAQLSDGDVTVDAVLYATGRRPNIAQLGLENTGITLTDQGYLSVNADFQTSEPSIYALGDMTGGWELTPVAIGEAMAFAQTQFGGQPSRMDYDCIPTAVFSQPPIGTVGMTEEEATSTGYQVVVYESNFRPLKHTVSGSEERTYMKLVVDRESDRVLGAHMVGSDAGEICQGLGIALKLGATKADFDRTVGIHPTAAEEFVTMRRPRA
ncbi:MAG: glutathione-disulfide reductase [Halieaceae bacterium]